MKENELIEWFDHIGHSSGGAITIVQTIRNAIMSASIPRLGRVDCAHGRAGYRAQSSRLGDFRHHFSADTERDLLGHFDRISGALELSNSVQRRIFGLDRPTYPLRTQPDLERGGVVYLGLAGGGVGIVVVIKVTPTA